MKYIPRVGFLDSIVEMGLFNGIGTLFFNEIWKTDVDSTYQLKDSSSHGFSIYRYVKVDSRTFWFVDEIFDIHCNRGL